ncbi:MAG: hypothetical protein KA436_06570 [Oligoflexales bacterium]|nr:hypothetical protein [Oligoflexales bacterium]
MSQRRYEETLSETAGHFGVSHSSVSRHIIEASSESFKELAERPLDNFEPFAIFIDGIHRGDSGFLVALGIDYRW